MNKQIAELILAWFGVYESLGDCIESARVVLDQTDRGTLLPDRVREMRGELLATQAAIPALADLMEELIDDTVWPMKAEVEILDPIPGLGEPDAEEEAELAPFEEPAPLGTVKGDYDASGATPVSRDTWEEEAAAEAVIGPDQAEDVDSGSFAE